MKYLAVGHARRTRDPVEGGIHDLRGPQLRALGSIDGHESPVGGPDVNFAFPHRDAAIHPGYR